MYNLIYVPTTLGLQSSRENISGSTRRKKVEYHCFNVPLQGNWDDRQKKNRWVVTAIVQQIAVDLCRNLLNKDMAENLKKFPKTIMYSLYLQKHQTVESNSEF